VLLTVILYSFPAQRRPESKRADLTVCPPGTEPVDTIYRGGMIKKNPGEPGLDILGKFGNKPISKNTYKCNNFSYTT